MHIKNIFDYISWCLDNGVQIDLTLFWSNENEHNMFIQLGLRRHL